VSFDIYFLSKGRHESWDDAMDALELAEGDERPLTDDDFATWDAIVAGVLPLVPSATTFAGDNVRELSDDETGLQLSMAGDELALTVPYWASGDEAAPVIDLLQRVSAVVESVTGLTAYDPQASAPFLTVGAASAGESFDRAHEVLTTLQDKGDLESLGSVRPSVSPVAERPTAQSTASAPTERKGWRRFFGV